MRRRRVLTDASVLSPRVARSILLRLADVGFFEIQWTSEIIQEMRQMILAKTPLLGRHSLNPLVHYMRVAYPNADVLDSDVLDTQEKLEVIPPQIKGYHIILAAVAGKVDSIVTVDRDRFATEICGDLGIGVITLDALLCSCWEDDEHALLQALIEQAVDRSCSSLEEMFQRVVLPLNAYAPAFIQRVLGTYSPPSDRRGSTVVRLYRHFGV